MRLWYYLKMRYIYKQGTGDTVRHWYYMKWNEKWWLNIYTRRILNFYSPFYPVCHKENFNNKPSCDAWRCPGQRRFCCRAGTPTPLPGALSWYGCKQLPVRWMGPPCSPQPGIDKLAWHPPVEFWGVACWPVCLPQVLKWQLEGRCSGLAYRIWDFRSCGFLRGLVGNGGRRAKAGSWCRWLGGEKAGAQGDSPQKAIETFCLRPHYGLLELSPHPSVSSCCASAFQSLCCFLLFTSLVKQS